MFKAHGKWQIYTQGCTIYIALYGAFNHEGVMAFQQAVLPIVGSLPEGQLTHAVLDLSHFEMSTPDSLEATKAYFLGVKQRNYQQVDYIGANVIAQSLLSQLWADSATQFHFYADEDAFLASYPQHHEALSKLAQISLEHPH